MDNLQTMHDCWKSRPITTTSVGDVVVLQHGVNDDDLAWSTLQNLFPVRSSLGDPERIEGFFRLVMRELAEPVTVFANPAFTVEAPLPCANFFKHAKSVQRKWFKSLNASLGSSQLVKEAMRRATPLMRQLEFTGIMIVDGKHIFPNRWGAKGVLPYPLEGRSKERRY